MVLGCKPCRISGTAEPVGLDISDASEVMDSLVAIESLESSLIIGTRPGTPRKLELDMLNLNDFCLIEVFNFWHLVFGF